MTASRPGAVERPTDDTRLSRVIAALLVVMVAVDALYLVALTTSGGPNSSAVTVALSLATQWVPVTVFWVVATALGFHRPSVMLAAIAVTVSAIGDTYYSLAMDAEGFLPFPSPADAGYLLFYPLMVASLVVLVRRALAGMGRLVVLESTVATLGAAALLSIVLAPVITGAIDDGDPLGSAIAVAYPVFDVLLLAVIAGVASVLATSVGRRSWALFVGLAVFAAADVAYALLENQGAYAGGTPLDATWAIGLAFITWWVAGVPGDGSPKLVVRTSRDRVTLPAVAVVAGFGVLLAGRIVELPLAAEILAAAAVALATLPLVFRQAMLGRMIADQERALRRLTELDREKADLLATVNHEFRTPLTSINGHVELLLDGGGGDLSAEAMGMLRTIERNGARLQSLIEETFVASRTGDPDAPVVRESLPLGRLAAQASSELAPAARRRGIGLTVTADEQDPVVDGDRGELRRVVLSLVDNAVKFTPDGGEVTVEVERSGESAVIRVRDTGIGIPADDLDRLFSRFFRAANAQKAAIPGVGLGLAIAHGIVSNHGGTIQAESVDGAGTTMTVRLPLSASVATIR